MDRLVSAFLKVPLKAYRGYGNIATGGGSQSKDKGTAWVPIQHKGVPQLYIPGLYIKGRKPQLYERAFPNPKIEFMAGNRRQVPELAWSDFVRHETRRRRYLRRCTVSDVFANKRLLCSA